MEETFFLKNVQGHNLFSVLHSPDNQCTNQGIILCSPCGEEKHESYRVLVNAARFFAQKGLYILRFDYYGSGDSEGDWSNATIRSRLEDINTAVDFMRMKIHENCTIGLMGVRLGATLAALAVDMSSIFSFLILWEPLIILKDYLYQWLRTNLTTQFVIYKKIVNDRNNLIEKLQNGELLNLEGFLLSTEMYQQAIEINLLDKKPTYAGPVFIGQWGTNYNSDFIKLAALYKQQNSSSQLFKLDYPRFWLESRPNEIFNSNLVDLYETTFGWLVRNGN